MHDRPLGRSSTARVKPTTYALGGIEPYDCYLRARMFGVSRAALGESQVSTNQPLAHPRMVYYGAPYTLVVVAAAIMPNFQFHRCCQMSLFLPLHINYPLSNFPTVQVHGEKRANRSWGTNRLSKVSLPSRYVQPGISLYDMTNYDSPPTFSTFPSTSCLCIQTTWSTCG